METGVGIMGENISHHTWDIRSDRSNFITAGHIAPLHHTVVLHLWRAVASYVPSDLERSVIAIILMRQAVSRRDGAGLLLVQAQASIQGQPPSYRQFLHRRGHDIRHIYS
jgi:hypothetical protein